MTHLQPSIPEHIDLDLSAPEVLAQAATSDVVIQEPDLVEDCPDCGHMCWTPDVAAFSAGQLACTNCGSRVQPAVNTTEQRAS